MLWLCLHFPRLPATALGLERAHEVVTERRGSQRWLVTSAPGLPIGTPLATAQSLLPQLVAHSRRVAAERAALRQLAVGAWRYGSPVAMELAEPQDIGRAPRAQVWIEIGASLRLFGGLDALLARLREDFAAQGQELCCGVAPTRAAAALLARLDGARTQSGESDPGLHPGYAQLEPRLAPLPFALLDWPDALLDALHGIGLRQIGELLKIPRASFARRFGEAPLLDLDRLLGRAPEPFKAVTLPPRFRRRFQMVGEVESVEGILFPLKRLCFELAAYLDARGVGAEGLRLHCEHAQGPPTQVELRYVAPVRDAAALFETLRERLTRKLPRAPVTELLLIADDFAEPQPLQTDLFDDSGGRALVWQRTLDRIQARLGDGSVWTPSVVDEHRPEFSWRRESPGVTSAVTEPRERPLWLLPKPQPLIAFRPEPVPSSPERLEGGWWDGTDQSRDYCTLEIDDARAWVFHDRSDDRWYLHGWWA